MTTVQMEKAWLYERLFFEVVIVMIKSKKKYSMKDTMSIKLVLRITSSGQM